MSTPQAAPRGGNRILLAVVCALAGLLYGALGTIGHRHLLRIGEVAVPWGLVAALVGVAALLIGLRLLVGRFAAGMAALGVIAMVAILSLPGIGGSVLVPGTILGTVWAVAPAIISVLVVAWPSSAALRRRPPTSTTASAAAPTAPASPTAE